LNAALGLLFAGWCAAGTVSSPDGSYFLSVPPGWSAMPPSGPADLFRLSGPQSRSAVISRISPAEYRENRRAVSRSLEKLVLKVGRRTGVELQLDPKLRRLVLAHGAELDYRLATAPARPAIVLAIGRVHDQILLIQVISQTPEENLRELVSRLTRPVLPPAPLPQRQPSGPSLRTLFFAWLGALAAILAAMAYWWRQLTKPSRRRRPSRIS
jgi:hypothetical protein